MSSNEANEEATGEEEELPPLRGHRVYLHVRKKIEIVERVQNAMRLNTGETLKGIAREEGVRPEQIRYWKKQLLELKEKEDEMVPI
jgi:hypothetical protein